MRGTSRDWNRSPSTEIGGKERNDRVKDGTHRPPVCAMLPFRALCHRSSGGSASPLHSAHAGRRDRSCVKSGGCCASNALDCLACICRRITVTDGRDDRLSHLLSQAFFGNWVLSLKSFVRPET